MSEDPDQAPEGTSAVVAAHSLSKNLKDKFVYFVDPDSDQCPKCGMKGSMNKGECQACGCWIQFSKEKAGTKVTVESMRAKGEQKPQKPQKGKKPAAKKAEDEDEAEPQDEEDDFEVEAASVQPRDLAIALLKKAKVMLKESSELLSDHFSGVVITFNPFMMKVQEKPKETQL